jgi:exodeoxyribonuclease-3
MKIVSWNVAGLRGSFKKSALNWLEGSEYDIICLQETKCSEEEANKVMPKWISEIYKYRYWNSCTGEYQHLGFQRKGLSGTSIWSKQSGIKLETPEFDKEGRTTAVEFSDFIIVTVYTPNSQNPKSQRFTYRVQDWDVEFLNYIQSLNNLKPTIICGDFNVAIEEKDVYNPVGFKNKVAGFIDEERDNFKNILCSGYKDAFRMFYPDDKEKYTFWTQMQPQLRKTNRGWRIDYFLVPTKLANHIIDCNILPNIMGSDHCPITLLSNLENTKKQEIKKKKYKLKLVESFDSN